MTTEVNTAQVRSAVPPAVASGVNSSTRSNGAPLMISSVDGAYVTDSDGKRYLDYHAAFGAILLGHKAPQVDRAVIDAIHNEPDLTGWGTSRLETQLAESLVAALPSVEQVTTVTTGSEAVAYALRIARASTDRRLIIKIQGGFHGWSDSVARNVISAPDRVYQMDPLSAGILPEALEATLVAEWNDIESMRELFVRHPEQIAAVIVEPIPHNVGALLPEPGYLEQLRKLTLEHGTMLILDEVITGFRHALGGYQELSGVAADLTTFGKSLGNGYAVAGVGGSAAVMSAVDPAAGGKVAIMGTFNGNPVACAAGIATIDYLRSHPEFYTRTHALGSRARTGLQGVFDDAGVAASVQGFGGTFTTYFLPARATGYRDLLANDAAASRAFHRGMVERGFLMLPIPMKRMHISGAFTEADIDATVEAAADVVSQLVAQGQLPLR
ncbi:aspartate aminotransferase family protein [Arthrobacter sp. KBS0702]|uniref:aspartate aminotransferase family protein n=1 Tax=Arthrobacter sp. KBS0702 TaxID=2578107 RepID=UPI00110D7215|nr:aspartate aminotransferase family protein [Arthrobacter sp. KBS0702]QDW30628.1 aspartate aminotransferase family protein [Arthrobacter sp. KBS0702]